jgi:hypothetical protein
MPSAACLSEALASIASDLIPAIHAALAGERFKSPNLDLGDKP